MVGQRNNLGNEMQSEDSGNSSLETYTLGNRKLPIASGGIERGIFWERTKYLAWIILQDLWPDVF